VLKFSTSRDQGLGDALPAGIVRVYMKDMRGNAQFVGESGIGHTPMGSDLALRTGEAFDVKVKPTILGRDRISAEEWKLTSRFRIFQPNGSVTRAEGETLERTDFYRTRMRYLVTNARPEPVTVDVLQSGLDSYWHDSRIVSESVKSERLSADQVVWRVPVPPNGSTALDVTFETRH
jgi:hypothetical protein